MLNFRHGTLHRRSGPLCRRRRHERDKEKEGKDGAKMSFYSSSPSTRPKTLMEVLLAKKIEAVAAEGAAGGPSKLFRTDSFDSVSSIGSLGSIVLGDDVCRCDDCLLGIVDLWIAGPAEKALAKKKVLI